MRRVMTLWVVLALASFVSADQASAFGRRAARYQNRGSQCAVAAKHQVQASGQLPSPVTTVASKSTVQSKPVADADQSALLIRLLDAMERIVALENDRLDRQLEHHRWVEEHDN